MTMKFSVYITYAHSHIRILRRCLVTIHHKRIVVVHVLNVLLLAMVDWNLVRYNHIMYK